MFANKKVNMGIFVVKQVIQYISLEKVSKENKERNEKREVRCMPEMFNILKIDKYFPSRVFRLFRMVSWSYFLIFPVQKYSWSLTKEQKSVTISGI